MTGNSAPCRVTVRPAIIPTPAEHHVTQPMAIRRQSRHGDVGRKNVGWDGAFPTQMPLQGRREQRKCLRRVRMETSCGRIRPVSPDESCTAQRLHQRLADGERLNESIPTCETFGSSLMRPKAYTAIDAALSASGTLR